MLCGWEAPSLIDSSGLCGHEYDLSLTFFQNVCNRFVQFVLSLNSVLFFSIIEMIFGLVSKE